MKVVILAGGVGSRLAEETESRPKPMVEIGGKPILWHIMKHYAHYGFKDFVICLGYKGTVIKKFFSDSLALASDLTIDFSEGVVRPHSGHDEDWRVTLVNTGERTETGGRLLRVREHLGDEPFMLTYGDGVADVDLAALQDFHAAHGKLVTVTAVHPLARFGHLDIGPDDRVSHFIEKPQMAEGWVNGGFFVVDPRTLDYIHHDVDWAKAPLESVASDGQLMAFRHEGFWQCMDTLRDRIYLENLWSEGDPPWRVWKH